MPTLPSSLGTLLTRAVDGAMEATVVPSFSRIGYAVRRRTDGWTPLDGYDLDGRTVLVTGANSGLGYATAERLAGLGAQVRLLVRSDAKGRDTQARIRAATDNDDVDFLTADLADLASVRSFATRFADEHDGLDVLVHNAGAMFGERRETVEGIETTVAVHVVGPFLLTTLLLPLLQQRAPSRVITVSSGGMYTEKLDVDRLESPDDYRPAVAYARAKRAQVVLTDQWARRFGSTGITFHAMHPGWAATPGVERSLPAFNRVMGPLLRDAEQGADTTVWLAASPDAGRDNGRFWLDRRPRSEHKVPFTRADDAEARRLWDHVRARAGVDPAEVLAT